MPKPALLKCVICPGLLAGNRPVWILHPHQVQRTLNVQCTFNLTRKP